METCAICRGELAPEWKFCVHCGSPVPPVVTPTDVPDLTTVVEVTSVTAAAHAQDVNDELEPIPSAIRPEAVLARPSRRIDARLVFGIAMAAIGAVAVVYAVISLLAARG